MTTPASPAPAADQASGPDAAPGLGPDHAEPASASSAAAGALPDTATPADAGTTGLEPAPGVTSGVPATVSTVSPDTVLPTPAGPAAGAATPLSGPTMLAPIVVPRRRPEGAPTSAPTGADGPDGTGAPAPDAAPADAAPPAGPDGGTPADGPPGSANGATSAIPDGAAGDGQADLDEDHPAAEADPERILAQYEWRFHHDTLRELVEDPEELRRLRDQLTEKLNSASDNGTRARLLSLRAVVSRILGDLGKALADAKLALVHAEATGQLRRIAIAQARLAHVLQWRGDYAEADRLFALANSTELPDRLRATLHEHAGRSCYDQGRYIEACNHFERSLDLRKVEDPDLMARTELALDAVARKVAEHGIGPYPRSEDEILRLHRPPVPAFDEQVGAWGYADADGTMVIPAGYADAQPFRDAVAWVRRPEHQAWELLDESGRHLIDATSGWLGVGSFADGLAWVSRDGTGAWVAIDKTGRVVISGGFDDVRPFRRGIAPVRRGGWGAVDRTGRLVVPHQFSGFTTALTDGRYIDGFTDEGLAIVDADGRKGVVDRNGRMIVPPTHPAIVIHPVAFLVADQTGAWGALDRRGRPLIPPSLPSRLTVTEEIDRLLADTKPVL